MQSRRSVGKARHDHADRGLRRMARAWCMVLARLSTAFDLYST